MRNFTTWVILFDFWVYNLNICIVFKCDTKNQTGFNCMNSTWSFMCKYTERNIHMYIGHLCCVFSLYITKEKEIILRENSRHKNRKDYQTQTSRWNRTLDAKGLAVDFRGKWGFIRKKGLYLHSFLPSAGPCWILAMTSANVGSAKEVVDHEIHAQRMRSLHPILQSSFGFWRSQGKKWNSAVFS